MLIHHLRKTTSGAGGGMSKGNCSCGGKIVAKPHRRVMGNGITNEVYDTDLGVVKPSRVLQNVRIKKANVPKKYITFD
jgi:hypothetical protein